MAQEVKLIPEEGNTKGKIILRYVINSEFGRLTTPLATLDNWDYYSIISESEDTGIIKCWNDRDYDNTVVYIFMREYKWKIMD